MPISYKVCCLVTHPQCSVRANCRDCSGGEILEVGEHVAHCAPIALPLLLIRAPLICDQQPIRGQYSGHVTCLDQSEASIVQGDEQMNTFLLSQSLIWNEV